MEDNFTFIKIKATQYREALDEFQLHGTTEGRIPRKFDGIFVKEYSGYVEYGIIDNCEIQQDNSFLLTVAFRSDAMPLIELFRQMLAEGAVEAFCGLSVEDYLDLTTYERQSYFISLMEGIVSDRVLDFAREQLSLAFKFRPIENSRPTTFSKFGGLVDLPKKFSYPKNEAGNSPLFLAQLDLGELSNSMESTKLIREQGFIYIFANLHFYDEYHMIEDFFIYYLPQDYDLESVPLPDDLKEYGAYPEMSILYRDEWNLPAGETSLWELDEMSPEEEESYTFLYEILDTYNSMPGIKLLGHPAQIQGCVLLETVFKAQQQAWYNPKGYDPEDFQHIYEDHRPFTKDWRLFMEADSMEDFLRDLPDFKGALNNYMDGIYYLMIRKEELKYLDFSNTECVYQTT